jgi:hypothetical protein
MPTDAEIAASVSAPRDLQRTATTRVPPLLGAAFHIHFADAASASPGALMIDVVGVATVTETDLLAAGAPQTRVDAVKKALAQILYVAGQKAAAAT